MQICVNVVLVFLLYEKIGYVIRLIFKVYPLSTQ